MKRAADSTEALVYAYGCGQPRAGLDAALAESARCRALWDRLVAIDRAADAAQSDAARADVPELHAAITEIIAVKADLAPLFEARSKVRSKARTKTLTQYDARIAELSERRRALRGDIWRMIAEWRKTHREQVAKIEAQRRAAVKAARQTSGLYWGNSNRVLDDYDRSRSLCRKTGKRLRESDEQRDDGCLTVQIQRTASGLGAAPEELHGAFAQFSIDPISPAAHDPRTPRGERGRLCQSMLHMRVDAEGAMIDVPVWMHRPLPPAARIKRVQLTWHREGGRMRWQIALTLTQPRVERVHPHPGTACGIDIGWRALVDGELRIAYLAGSAGTGHSIDLPAEWMRGMDHVETLRGRIDTMELDERSREARECAGLRARLLRNRRERYRLLAREIAMRYATVAIDDNDLGALARSKDAVAGGLRARAALSEFVRELDHQCAKHGTRLLRAEGASTIRCHACGAHTEPRDRTDLIWTCHACGVLWDQDENAARNLLLFAVATASGDVAKADASKEINGLRERPDGLKRSARKPALESNEIGPFG